MKLKERIDLLVQLGEHLSGKDEYLEALMHRTYHNNKWFVIENIQKSLNAICTAFLDRTKLEAWVKHYYIDDNVLSKTIGVVMAGNIPLVGFHDFLCIFIVGHKAQLKLSDKDKYLFPYLLKLMTQFNPAFAAYAEIVEQLKDFDAVIATGSNNSARYFDAYFGKYPHIIRKNRNAIGVLDGTETEADILALGQDIFQYFGLGCRNVSKIYVPKDYDFTSLLETLHEGHKKIVLHSKYKNNFDYNYALYMLNSSKYLSNGCLILTENKAIQSRIAGLHYEYYDEKATLEATLANHVDEIQCIVSKQPLTNFDVIPLGNAQKPSLMDYADGVDSIRFLLGL